MWDGPKISFIEKDIEAHFQIAIDGAAWNDLKKSFREGRAQGVRIRIRKQCCGRVTAVGVSEIGSISQMQADLVLLRFTGTTTFTD